MQNGIHGERESTGRNSTDETALEWQSGDAVKDGPAVQQALVRLASLRQQKSDLAGQEKEIFDELESVGHTKRAIKYVIMLEKMDPDDRQSYLGEVEALITFKKFW